MKISAKIIKTIEAEIKTKENLIKVLAQDAKDYNVDNSQKIGQLQEVVNNYKKIIKDAEE